MKTPKSEVIVICLSHVYFRHLKKSEAIEVITRTYETIVPREVAEKNDNRG